jgi:hypothetical protein
VVSVVPAVTVRPVAWVVSARWPVSTGWLAMVVTAGLVASVVTALTPQV